MVPVVLAAVRHGVGSGCARFAVVPAATGGGGVRCENQHPEGQRGDACYVLQDEHGKQRAVCGDCAAEAVSSVRRIHLFPIEAVGEQTMRRKARAQGRHPV